MLENLPEWADKLITVSIGAAVMYAAVEFIKKLLINVNKKDERINDIFTAQLQVLMENSTDYKKELTDVKKLILNTTNMSTGDFQTYIATLNRMIHYRMMFEIGDIIDKNHINTNTLELTIKKIKNINELKNGDTILLPNDPTNLARSLILLDKAGIIKLNNNKNIEATLKDIASNPKNLKFEELSAEQLPPRLPEVAASIVNSSFALNAGLSYKEDGLVKEDKDSPYANVLATLKGNENDPRIQKLLKALQSEKVKKYMEEKYKDVIIPVF